MKKKCNSTLLCNDVIAKIILYLPANEIIDLISSNPTGINYDPNFSPIHWFKGAVAPKELQAVVNSTYAEILETSGYNEKLNEVQNLTFPKYLIFFAFKSFKYSADSLLDAIHEEKELKRL